MTEIDVATGLPRLPENQRWSVTKSETYYRDFSTFVVEKSKPILNGFTVSVEWLRPAHEVTRSVREEQEQPRKWWGGKRPTKTVEVEKIEQVPEGWAYTGEKWFIKPDKMNAAAVLAAAHNILELRKIEEERDALVGTYPPKKLEV